MRFFPKEQVAQASNAEVQQLAYDGGMLYEQGMLEEAASASGQWISVATRALTGAFFALASIRGEARHAMQHGYRRRRRLRVASVSESLPGTGPFGNLNVG